MSNRIPDPGHAAQGGHAGAGFWAAVAACVPVVVIFALIALKII